MSSWYSSWLPGLPSIDFALPSTIQRRFLSFILKKSLGHLLKPGQFDVHQIDSQIGAGHVQVRDLELDNEVINTHLSGLPIKLHDGSISAVIARIPWPNPLTSTLGCTLQSLHLTFHLSPATRDAAVPPVVNIADSVTSVAQSFIHDELSSREETALRESLHPDLRSSEYDDHNIPGGLNPFLSAHDNDGDEFSADIDPSGVSIFATLIERLLARFTFDATDTKITLVHPGHTSFTLSVQSIQYGTEANASDGVLDVQPEGSQVIRGQTRTVSISGVNLTAHNIRPAPISSPAPLTPSTLSPVSPTASSRFQAQIPSTHRSRSVSPSSSSSSLDEDTQLMMSQSLACLPPRPLRAPSPANSMGSSMYQSAISTIAETDSDPHDSDQGRSRTPSPGGHRQPSESHASRTHEALFAHTSGIERPPMETVTQIEDKTIFSFGTDPILIRLTTPPPNFVPQSSPPSAQSPSRPVLGGGDKPGSKEQETLKLSVSTGVFACALHAWHVRRLLDVCEVLGSHLPHAPPAGATPTASTPTDPPMAFLGLGLEVEVRIRGVVLLLLPSSTMAPRSPDSLSKFFAGPLVLLHLPSGYVRAHAENLTAFFLLSTTSSKASSATPVTPTREPRTTRDAAVSSIVVVSTFSLGDLSVVAFRTLGHDSELIASPVLITDHHLPAQYPSTHIHPDPSATLMTPSVHPERQRYPELPVLNVTDWTDETYKANSHKISTWRSKPNLRTSRQSDHIRRDGQARATGIRSVTNQSVRPPAAVVVNAKTIASSPSRKAADNGNSIEVKAIPIHIFVDLELALCHNALAFLDEVIDPGLNSDSTGPKATMVGETESEDEGDDEDNEVRDNTGSIPPAIPHTRSVREREWEREMERRRLEKLVLQDLDLDIDYQAQTSNWNHDISRPEASLPRRKSKRKPRSRRRGNPLTVAIKLTMIRLQIRCPSPPHLPRRSGALVVDIHDINLIIPAKSADSRPTTRFAGVDDPATLPRPGADEGLSNNGILSVEWGRLIIASSAVGEGKASAMLSVGPLFPGDDEEEMTDLHMFDATASPSSPKPASPILYPRVLLTRSNPTSISASPSRPGNLALSFDLPSVHANVSKTVLDSVQIWADDATQLLERTFGGDIDTEKADSRDPSLIGSRFFAKSRKTGSRGSESESGSRLSGSDEKPTKASSEIVIKVAISEMFIRLLLPRGVEESLAVRPFNVSASDVDILMEFKPEGKDETVFTVGVMDLTVTDTSPSNTQVALLSMTSPRSLSAAPKSLLKLRFTSSIIPETTAKESKVKVTLCGFMYNLLPDLKWAAELGLFFKAPPGTFESVVPSERTRVSVKIIDGSVRTSTPTYPGSLVLYLGESEFSTDVVGESPEISFSLTVHTASILLVDDLHDSSGAEKRQALTPTTGLTRWKTAGFALLAEVADLDLTFNRFTTDSVPDTRVVINHSGLRVHLCADTISALTALSQHLTSAFRPSSAEEQAKPKARREPSTISEQPSSHRGIMSTIDEHAFRRPPDVGSAPDMISDDLPSNLDYLDESFSAAAGLRELRDDDLDEFDLKDGEGGRITPTPGAPHIGTTSNVGGETIKIIHPVHVIEDYFDTLPPESISGRQELGETTIRIRVYDCDVTLFLYDGYDWARTRKTIEDEIKEMRRRLAKIRQLVANGQTQDPSVEETSALLFNSVYIGLEQDADELEPGALIAAIDEELNEDIDAESQSSWQSLRPPSGRSRTQSVRVHGKRLTRSRGPSIEFRLSGIDAEVDHYRPGVDVVSRTLATVRDVEILDHIKTSTWKKFLTELRSDSQGNIRETDSNMVRVELRSVRPVPNHPSEEARLRAKILPLRLYVDQDALDFLKKFFNFKDPNDPAIPNPGPSEGDIYFQHAEVFPVGLKLDYKPRRVDYRALREGRTIELMNFFHFDGAEMTLRHITLSGITGWPRLFDLLNDLWTPDVKATQLVDVISGVSPIRSVVNVGSGVADLVLLPIAQYKKDGRIVRGVQKGTTAFVKSTAMEAIKLGARLATGTQVILEQAENVLGGRFDDSVTAEALQILPDDFMEEGQRASDEEEEMAEFSRYASQPGDIREGVQSAYRSLHKNLNSAAQTILAVPMEVYERSGNEGPVRAVIRAVPIAVLKPMIGASEAVSKTLMGLHNTLDPNVRHENEAKYKQR